MKKLTKKLFISVMTLVLTAMALGTSTFAWFSMNTTVNATDMQVTAKSNATYLLIGTGDNDTATEIQTTSAITVVAAKSDGTTDNNRYPAAFNNTGAAITVGGASIADKKWYSASNQYSDAATSSVQNGNQIADADLVKYVVKYTVYLTLSADSEDYAASKYVKLTFSKGAKTATGTNDAAIAAVVKIGDNYYKLNETTDHVYLNLPAALTSATTQQVDIFIYVDGESANVNSDFFNTTGNSLTGTVGIQFDLTFDAHND